MENLANGQVNNENCESITVNNCATTSSSSKKDIDLDFLPLIYDIIKSIEREPTQEASGKSREGQDTSSKVLELEKKLNEARQQILLLPGIEHSPEKQLRLLEKCRQQVQLKQQLIHKYKSLGTFPPAESTLSESYPIRRAAQLVVYFFNRGKAITEDSKLIEQLNKTGLTERLKSIRDHLEKENRKY